MRSRLETRRLGSGHRLGPPLPLQAGHFPFCTRFPIRTVPAGLQDFRATFLGFFS